MKKIGVSYRKAIVKILRWLPQSHSEHFALATANHGESHSENFALGTAKP
jgi:hypothetical protein